MRRRLADLAERALWTFVQAFAGAWVGVEVGAGAGGAEISTWEQFKATLIAAALAGLVSVAKNLSVTPAPAAPAPTVVVERVTTERAASPDAPGPGQVGGASIAYRYGRRGEG